jgi:hypothetical protein
MKLCMALQRSQQTKKGTGGVHVSFLAPPVAACWYHVQIVHRHHTKKASDACGTLVET